VGHAAHIREMNNADNILVGKPEGMNHWEDLDIDDKMLQCILGKSVGRYRLDASGSG
jgi:hypothetical protein